MKEIKEDTNKCKDINVYRTLSIVKICILPKEIYRFKAIPIRIKTACQGIAERDKFILKFIWNLKGLHSQSNFERNTTNLED